MMNEVNGRGGGGGGGNARNEIATRAREPRGRFVRSADAFALGQKIATGESRECKPLRYLERNERTKFAGSSIDTLCYV